MTRWWSSDFHMGHWNVIRYSNRPVKDVPHMHEVLINNWNSVVTPDDDMWFLGDFSMSQRYLWMLTRFNFNHMAWILGNHDKAKRIYKEMEEGGQLFTLRDKITVLEDGCFTTVDGHDFEVVHRPMDGMGEFPTLCGHVHEKWCYLPAGTKITEHSRSRPPSEKILSTPTLNVGVDVHNMFPINDDQVLRFFNEQS
jgi:calcineurin-like phosphoesterase family protein